MKNLFLFLLSYFFPIKKNKIFQLNDLIFYDPVSNLECNETNYWTFYNQNTTCYRFLSIEVNDTSNKKNIKLILDHDIESDTFINAKKVLYKKTSNWKKEILNIKLISQNQLSTVLKTNEEPSLKNPKIKAPFNGHLFCNTKIFLNKKEYNIGGYWTETLYNENNNYAFALTDEGYNSIININEKKGIRPVITIEKKYLNNPKFFSNITDIFYKEKSTEFFKYPSENKTYEGYYYGDLQGFSITNNLFIFHSSNDSNPYKGILYIYSGENYKKLTKIKYGLTGHGNGIAYNNIKNTIIIASANIYKNTLEYSLPDLKLINNFTKGFCGIGYDYNNNLYVGYIDRRVYFLDINSLNEIYTFDLTNFETTQDLEYYNGYVFFATSNFFAGDFFQKYSFYKENSSIIYVYNAKIENGKPSKNFGMIEDILYIEPFGEIEAIEFLNGFMYYGFGRRKEDKFFPYNFYKVNYEKFINYTKLKRN